MKKFVEYITEMPHVEYGENRIFDLEAENFAKKPLEFLDFIKDILTGKFKIDKYGNKIQLDNPIEKKKFIEELKHNFFIHMWLKSVKKEKEFNELLKKEDK